jgi:hypothetical protein
LNWKAKDEYSPYISLYSGKRSKEEADYERHKGEESKDGKRDAH